MIPPVNVLQDEHHRFVDRIYQKAADARKEEKHLLHFAASFAAARLCDCSGEERGDRATRCDLVIGGLAVVEGCRQVGFDQPAPGPERRRARLFVAVTPVRCHVMGIQELLGQPGLACTGVAGDEHDTQVPPRSSASAAARESSSASRPTKMSRARAPLPAWVAVIPSGQPTRRRVSYAAPRQAPSVDRC